MSTPPLATTPPVAPLTPPQVEASLQSFTATILGLSLADPTTPSLVRIGWQQEGQPAWGINDDVVIVMAKTIDEQINRLRDRTQTSSDGTTIQQQTNYIRVWEVDWTFYGPNSFDHARIIRSGLFLDNIHDLFVGANLYLVTDPAEPVRAPELFAGDQWWERIDFKALFNELVTEGGTAPAMASAEVLVYTATSPNINTPDRDITAEET